MVEMVVMLRGLEEVEEEQVVQMVLEVKVGMGLPNGLEGAEAEPVEGLRVV
jgi:hypothetical protein